jgi:hypothetical protein
MSGSSSTISILNTSPLPHSLVEPPAAEPSGMTACSGRTA